MPGVLSATLGIWVGVGSRDGSPALSGSSHFLEHLLFKGTTSRSALEIATAMDAVGGEMNAFTAKEHTCYYANVLASDLPLAVALLSDLVTEACNTAEDLESERTVVLEEIAMRDDEPSDAVHDLRSEEHTSELQSRLHLVCRLLLEKKKKNRETQSNLQSTPHSSFPRTSLRAPSCLIRHRSNHTRPGKHEHHRWICCDD